MSAIRVGVTLPRTGRYARKAGVIYERTYRFWMDRVNRAGGLLGNPVELVVHDDGSEPSGALAGYRRLIHDDGVDLLLGPCHSDLVEAIAPLVEQGGRVLLQGSGSSHEIFEQGRRNVFLCWSGCDFDYPRSMFELLREERGTQRVTRCAVVYTNGRIGTAVGHGVRHFARELGFDLVFDEPIGDPPVDYHDLFRRASLANPQLVMIGLDHTRPDDPVRSAVSAFRATHPENVVLWLSDNPSAHDPTDLINGAFMRTTWIPQSPDPVSRSFVAEYTAANDEEPEYHHAGGYSCCQVLEQAVSGVGGCDQETLRSFLLANAFDTVMGTIRFRDSGLPDASMQLSQWVDGSLRIVYPSATASASAAWPWSPTHRASSAG